MDEQIISEYQHMWTTDREDYRLIEGEDKNLVIFQVSTTGMPIIEDGEVFEAVIQRMLQAGVKIITTDNLNNYLNVRVFGENTDGII
jgi:hypothetical protein